MVVQRLEGAPYRLEFGAEGPILYVDDRIDHSLLTADSSCQALLLPALLKAILIHILLVERCSADDFADDEKDWRTEWMELGRQLSGEEPPPDSEDAGMMYQWIERCVESFCRKHGLLSHLLRQKRDE